MEPLKPERKKRILATNPQAAPEEIEEYERLLAERFTVDPDLPKDTLPLEFTDKKAARLRELRRKLFPSEDAPETKGRAGNA